MRRTQNIDWIFIFIKVLFSDDSAQLIDAGEHQVLEQDTGEISPGGRRERGKECLGSGGGFRNWEKKVAGGRADFEALYSFLLGFCLQGFANILPTQFQAC